MLCGVVWWEWCDVAPHQKLPRVQLHSLDTVRLACLPVLCVCLTRVYIQYAMHCNLIPLPMYNSVVWATHPSPSPPSPIAGGRLQNSPSGEGEEEEPNEAPPPEAALASDRYVVRD